MKAPSGALDTDAPEFLDFLIGASPVDRQTLYRNGLDALNAQARTRFGKAFADLDAAQADAILKPLLVPVAWAYDPPKDRSSTSFSRRGKTFGRPRETRAKRLPPAPRRDAAAGRAWACTGIRSTRSRRRNHT